VSKLSRRIAEPHAEHSRATPMVTMNRILVLLEWGYRLMLFA
jgi:hypothetical protein